MAIPIAATPVLKGKDANAFLNDVEQKLKKPAKYVSTPKLEQAKELIRKYAARGQK